MHKKYWWQPIFIVMVVGLAGVMFMGIRTYQDAPPIEDFVTPAGETLFTRGDILAGQAVFLKYALMDYGSMFGDGASRGPDFTAEALHEIAGSMKQYYLIHAMTGNFQQPGELLEASTEVRVKKEIKKNGYAPAENKIIVSNAQAFAFKELLGFYKKVFRGEGENAFRPANYISNQQELRQLTCFFYWGAWVCGAERPGNNYSYTHNWPYDPEAGNLPTSATLFWSVFGSLGLIMGIGIVLYLRGRLDRIVGLKGSDKSRPFATEEFLAAYKPTNLQKSTYKYFWVAAVLFLLQVLAGALTIHDFVGLTNFFGYELSEVLPITITRSWHLQLSLMWISACWIGSSIFLLPLICAEQPKGQVALSNFLFSLVVVVVLGTVVGTYLGPHGALGEWWRFLGHQGWEFVELGRLWQIGLFACFALWAYIIFRGIYPSLAGAEPLALPNWMFYSILSILIFFCAGFVATPETNFVIADFWRWCVIHMWAEAFFEVFTTAIVAYFMYRMGLVSSKAAARVVYLATLLFLGSGILGISHNFYWNAKPVATLAIGSIFSTLQVVPLIVLTLEAWRFRRLPAEAGSQNGQKLAFGQNEAFLFLVGVNFWNFLGAGVFGFIINLPIVNYYEHGTYLTVNHGHAALMGVYGNLAIAAMLFCSRYMIPAVRWSAGLLRCAFWSINIGLMLMVVMDLFPAGVIQLAATLDHGLWFSRSQEFVLGLPFQTLTWLRAVGGYLFLLGGVIPITWFLVSRTTSIKASTAELQSVELADEAPAQQISL